MMWMEGKKLISHNKSYYSWKVYNYASKYMDGYKGELSFCAYVCVIIIIDMMYHTHARTHATKVAQPPSSVMSNTVSRTHS